MRLAKTHFYDTVLIMRVVPILCQPLISNVRAMQIEAMQPTPIEVPSPDAFHNIPGGWSLVLNSIEVTHPLPYEISPGIRLARASSEQVQKIKRRLESLLGDGHFGWSQFYECVFEKSPENADAMMSRPLAPNQWRYYIIETDDYGKMNIDLQHASNASLIPLDTCSVTFMNNGGFGWRTGSLHYHFFGKTFEPPIEIGSDELADLTNSYNQYIQITGGTGGKTEFPEILRAQDLLDSLSLIPTYSDFHILGLFAIIEMLITHNPKLEDRGDSITHQMQSKIPLLSKRFIHKPTPEQFFGNASEKKTWSALYKYRSAIAHGGVADFGSAELQILKDAHTAKAFLLDVVRKMIRHSFAEPVLFRDLRAC